MRYTVAALAVSALLATGAAADSPDAVGTPAPEPRAAAAAGKAVEPVASEATVAIAETVAAGAAVGGALVGASQAAAVAETVAAGAAAGEVLVGASQAAVAETVAAGAAAGEALAGATENAAAVVEAAAESVAETQHTLGRVTDRLAAAKTSLDEAVAGLISASGLDRTSLAPNQVYGVMVGAVGGALLADAFGAGGLATLSLAVTTGALGGYLGGGDAIDTASVTPAGPELSAIEPLDGVGAAAPAGR